MEKKDLAEEYAEKEYERVNGDSEPIFTDETCFTFEDIKYAFDAGRESVVESIPELKWIDGPDAIGDFEEVFHEVCIAPTHFGDYYIRYFSYSKSYVLFYDGEKISNDFKLLNDAKLLAEEDYQNRIKKVLEL